MIEFRKMHENSGEDTVTTDIAVVFVAPGPVNDTHRKFTEFNPVVAQMLRDRFSASVDSNAPMTTTPSRLQPS